MVDRIDTRTSVAVRQWPIVLLRVYTGIFFVYHGVGNLRRSDFPNDLAGFVTSQLDASFSFYRPFLEAVVLPNKEIFASVIAWGQVAIGLALVVGLATRYAAFVGAFMVLNFWLASGDAPLAGQNPDMVWFVILIVLGFIPAGKIAGLDDGLSDKLPFLR